MVSFFAPLNAFSNNPISKIKIISCTKWALNTKKWHSLFSLYFHLLCTHTPQCKTACLCHDIRWNLGINILCFSVSMYYVQTLIFWCWNTWNIFFDLQMCSKVIQPSSLVVVFETLLSSAATTVDEEKGNPSWQACADFYITCILSCLPWGGAELMEVMLLRCCICVYWFNVC